MANSVGEQSAIERHGSCLCGAVKFAVTGTIRGVGSCHCSKCRKVSGTNGNAIFLVPADRFEWVDGQDHTDNFAFPSGWGVTRCQDCGSPLPASHDGKLFWVPAGLMNDPLETDIKQHIFCGSRADWDKEAVDAQHFDEAAK